MSHACAGTPQTGGGVTQTPLMHTKHRAHQGTQKNKSTHNHLEIVACL